MPTQTSRSISPGKTMVTAKIATTDVDAARHRAESEGRTLTEVIASAVRVYGRGTPVKKEPSTNANPSKATTGKQRRAG